jgi:hypothetical protein
MKGEIVMTEIVIGEIVMRETVTREIVTTRGADTGRCDPVSIERSVQRPLKEDECQVKK